MEKDDSDEFQEQCVGLEQRIDGLSAAPPHERPRLVEACLAGVGELSDRLKEVSPNLPPYEQRARSERVKGLASKLAQARQALLPKARFAFKSRGNQAGNIGGDVRTDGSGPGASDPKSAGDVSAENVVLSGRTGELIRVGPSAGPAASILLSSLNGCVVTVSPEARFPTAAVKEIRSSVIQLHCAIDGPAHFTGITNCAVVLKCRQFRMHGARSVDVYLHCSSQPIIEDCKDVRFAPYGGAEGNMWDQVMDFKWLKAEQSPNWGIVPDGERRELIEPTGGESNVRSCLARFLPAGVEPGDGQ